MKEKKYEQFSVSLGLLDYINPVLYCITSVTVIKNTFADMGSPYNIFLLIGAVMSVLFGFIIPTGKVIVGLGIIEFRMPVSLVFIVNAGILISGLMLFHYIINLNGILFVLLIAIIVILLCMIYLKYRKINTIAVLTGAVGYLFLYASLITLSLRKGITLPILLYAAAILIFIMLCGIGIKADLKNPKIHWIIETANVLCQFLVATASIVLFSFV